MQQLTLSLLSSLFLDVSLWQIFNQLKHAAGTEYRILNNSQEYKAIDIRDMHKWSLYNPNYKFLPKLKRNSTVSSSSSLYLPVFSPSP